MMLGPFRSPFYLIFQRFFHTKNASILGSIFGGLWEGFWDARPSKMELSLKRNAHFDKVAFFAPGRFFDAKRCSKGSQNGAEKLYKMITKSDAFLGRKK